MVVMVMMVMMMVMIMLGLRVSKDVPVSEISDVVEIFRESEFL